MPDRDHNFVADMSPATLLVTPQRCLIQAPLTDAVRAPGGCAALGLLMTLVDIAASDPALVACHPDWTATQDLSVHGAGWLDEGPVVVDCRLARVGKKVVVVTSDLYDGHGVDDFGKLQAAIDGAAIGQGAAAPVTRAGSSLLTFARLPRTAASNVDDYLPARWLGQVRHRVVERVGDGTIYERMGLEVIDAATGCVQLHRTSYVANSIGTINGGAQAFLAQVAAETMRPGRAAVDMQMHFLSQVKAGPARSHATVLRDSGDHTVVDVRLVDAGHDEQVLALATVTLRAR
jgi:acyl-coenzyme A thioesterase PaaI-like protein